MRTMPNASGTTTAKTERSPVALMRSVMTLLAWGLTVTATKAGYVTRKYKQIALGQLRFVGKSFFQIDKQVIDLSIL